MSFQPLSSKFQNNSKAIQTRASEILAPHQIDVLQKVCGFFKSKYSAKPAIVVVPTGGGKTGIICALPYFLAEEHRIRRILLITPSKIITTQLLKAVGGVTVEEAFLARIVPVDLRSEVLPSTRDVTETSQLKSGYLNIDAVIANAHKFHTKEGSKWREALPSNQFDLIIVDEAHHLPSETWNAIITHFHNSKKVFLTATPFRSDKKNLSDYFGVPFAYEMKRDEAVSKGIIRDVEFLSVPEPKEGASPVEPVIKKVISVLEEKNHKNPLLDGISHQAILLAGNSAAAENIAGTLVSYGVPTVAYHSGIDKNTNGSNLGRFKKGELKALVVVGMLLEGFNHEPISVAGILTNVQSGNKFVQFVGRAVRKVAGEQNQVATIVTCDVYKQKKLFDSYKDDTFIFGETFDSVDEEPAHE